jgi:hypothetical protein
MRPKAHSFSPTKKITRTTNQHQKRDHTPRPQRPQRCAPRILIICRSLRTASHPVYVHRVRSYEQTAAIINNTRKNSGILHGIPCIYIVCDFRPLMRLKNCLYTICRLRRLRLHCTRRSGFLYSLSIVFICFALLRWHIPGPVCQHGRGRL